MANPEPESPHCGDQFSDKQPQKDINSLLGISWFHIKIWFILKITLWTGIVQILLFASSVSQFFNKILQVLGHPWFEPSHSPLYHSSGIWVCFRPQETPKKEVKWCLCRSTEHICSRAQHTRLSLNCSCEKEFQMSLLHKGNKSKQKNCCFFF